MHEYNANLRLGAASDWEWAKTASSSATADGSDEDGLAYVRIYVNGTNYQTDVRVYNNTLANATVCAWLDLDTDGVFDPGEGVTQTVSSSTSTQNISLSWNNAANSLPNFSNTYLRIRITSAANGMTTSNPTGFYLDGEVEDYFVVVNNTPLAVKLTDFTARKLGEDRVSLTWTVSDEEPNTQYEVQKSTDGVSWSSIGTQTAQRKSAQASYATVDGNPFSGTNYYRLKITETDGTVQFSAVRKVNIDKQFLLQVVPNPAASSVRLSIQSGARTSARVRVLDILGRVALERNYLVEQGLNQYVLPVEQFVSGVYQVEVGIDSRVYTQPLVVRK